MMHSDSRVKEPVCLATTSLPDPCLSTYLSPRFREEPKIGCEISFNKYFYRHKPLRKLEAVAQEIIDLEKQADGLIAQILGLTTSSITV